MSIEVALNITIIGRMFRRESFAYESLVLK